MEPLFEYKRVGFSLAVFANRIDVTRGTWFKKRESLLLRNVTDVTLTGSGRLEITTSDGKKHKYTTGLGGQDARQAILNSLP
jgi:predicted transport protein